MGAQSTKSDSTSIHGNLTTEEVTKLKKRFNTLNSFTAVGVGSKGEKGLVCPYGDFQVKIEHIYIFSVKELRY
jgi:hypothetical protein